jgi:hypothetical protein
MFFWVVHLNTVKQRTRQQKESGVKTNVKRMREGRTRKREEGKERAWKVEEGWEGLRRRGRTERM